MVSVGLSKEDQAVEVELERTRLPDSRREAEETEREAVLESQMVWEEPLRRRRVPEERKWMTQLGWCRQSRRGHRHAECELNLRLDFVSGQ